MYTHTYAHTHTPIHIHHPLRRRAGVAHGARGHHLRAALHGPGLGAANDHMVM